MHSDLAQKQGSKSRLLPLRVKRIRAPMQTKTPPVTAGEGAPSRDECSCPFWGYTDELASAEDMASITRAREILAAGVTQLAIKKAVR